MAFWDLDRWRSYTGMKMALQLVVMRRPLLLGPRLIAALVVEIAGMVIAIQVAPTIAAAVGLEEVMMEAMEGVVGLVEVMMSGESCRLTHQCLLF
mmetsp:Transcript_85406/g.135391  ORF Transcript_85406/g.135391 Transcript_85406/m.135391 type:complete len:95 (+) Transcript_85406:473-757(+)